MPLTPPPLPVKRLHVYEVFNVARKESVLALSAEDTERSLEQRLRRAPPPGTEGWDLGRDALSVVLLAPRMLPRAAEEFVALYLDNMRQRTWRFHLWRVDS
ncbi:MAG: hypothetical protein SF051_16590 [Elusimicrobiota bacterium]|nr:hypothetical protein [Elusimicrobiota bacterium]